MLNTFFTRLLQHRVPQFLGLYLGAAWGVVQFVDWLVKRYLLSVHLTDIALFTFLSLTPAAVLVAYTHGAPGKQGWGRAEKIGVPLNLFVTAILLVVLFHGKDIGASTERLVVADAEGQATERQDPKASFRRQAVLFFWTNKTDDPKLDWLQYGFPQMLALDLRQDPFLQVWTPYHGSFFSQLRRAGYDTGLNVPMSLQRRIAKSYHLPYFLDGEFDGGGEALHVTVTLYRTDPTRQVAQRSFTGEDPTEIVDRITRQLKSDLEIPAGSVQLANDLPVAEHVSESPEAIAAYVAGLNSNILASDIEQAIADWRRAVARDPSFALAHLRLAEVYVGLGRLEDTRAAIDEALRHEYKLTERDRFSVKGFDYMVTGQHDKRTALYQAWVELYPEDVAAHIALASAYVWEDRADDAAAIYRKIRQIDPSADWVLRNIAALLKNKGEYEEAIELIMRYSALHPEEHGPLLDLGQIHESTGDLVSAREHYEKASVLSSRMVTPLINLARVDLKEGRVDDAVGRLAEATSFAETPQQEGSVMAARLELFGVRGQLEETLELQRQWAEVEKKYRMHLDVMIDVWVTSNESYVFTGRLNEVVVALEEFFAKNEPLLDLFATIGLMQAYVAAEDVGQATVYLERAARAANDLNRKDILALTEFAAGRIQELRGNYLAAVGIYERALTHLAESAQDTFADSLKILTALGRARRLSARPEAAKEALEKVLRLFPAYPEAHLELARLHEALGDAAASRSHLESALEFWRDADPSYPPARAARAIHAGRTAG